jgi:hypothetical protein
MIKVSVTGRIFKAVEREREHHYIPVVSGLSDPLTK